MGDLASPHSESHFTPSPLSRGFQKHCDHQQASEPSYNLFEYSRSVFNLRKLSLTFETFTQYSNNVFLNGNYS